MPDQTDRQRAEAIATEALLKRRKELGPYGLLRGEDEDVANIADALLSARREGWEAGREDAAKAEDARAESHDFQQSEARARKHVEAAARLGDLANENRNMAAAIRALKPKES
jgi:hypothetical protein